MERYSGPATPEGATGLMVTFAPFLAAVQWGGLLHTVLGLVLLVPMTWYVWIHWRDYRRYNLSDSVLLGYVAAVSVLVCAASGLVVTWQGLFALRMSPAWRQVHLWSTWALIATVGLHVVLVLARDRGKIVARPALRTGAWTLAGAAPCLLLIGAPTGSPRRTRSTTPNCAPRRELADFRKMNRTSCWASWTDLR